MKRTYLRLDTHQYYFGRTELAKEIGCTPANITNAQKNHKIFIVKDIYLSEKNILHFIAF